MEKIRSGFVTDLDIKLCSQNEDIWYMDQTPLVYNSALLGCQVVIPSPIIERPFYTDLASVPRIPIIYEIWGNRAHREAVLHDYLFRKNSIPIVSFTTANRVFLEAMLSTGKPWRIAYPMFWGVMMLSYLSYHDKYVEHNFGLERIGDGFRTCTKRDGQDFTSSEQVKE
jgi:hypothetical protein